MGTVPDYLVTNKEHYHRLLSFKNFLCKQSVLKSTAPTSMTSLTCCSSSSPRECPDLKTTCGSSSCSVVNSSLPRCGEVGQDGYMAMCPCAESGRLCVCKPSVKSNPRSWMFR